MKENVGRPASFDQEFKALNLHILDNLNNSLDKFHYSHNRGKFKNTEKSCFHFLIIDNRVMSTKCLVSSLFLNLLLLFHLLKCFG